MLTNKVRVLKSQTIILGTLCMLLSGCATMFAPGSDKVTIKTDPPGASVYEGANFLGKTPLTYSFKRETFEKKTLTIKKEGYASQELDLKKALEKTALWNFGFFITTSGATSWGIDALSGNMTKYYPGSYFIDLSKRGDAAIREDHLRLQRIRFVLLNQDNLMKDIAAGDGNYLRAYFEMRPPKQTFDNYQGFLNHVSGKAPLLHCLDDPVEFYHELEKRTGEEI
jgi:hypothetical protein